MTNEELNEIKNKMEAVTDKANETCQLLEDIIKGGPDDVVDYEGKEFPSLTKLVKDAIDDAIATGKLELPSGKIINDIYINEDGELIIDIQEF